MIVRWRRGYSISSNNAKLIRLFAFWRLRIEGSVSMMRTNPRPFYGIVNLSRCQPDFVDENECEPLSRISTVRLMVCCDFVSLVIALCYNGMVLSST